MPLHERVAVTVRLILAMLFRGMPSGSPEQACRSPFFIPVSPSVTVPPSEACSAPQLPGSPESQLRCPGALPVAAPFILYRLKRSGFSGCRVTVERGGLRVDARR
jgi:hypothetical protein